MRLSFSVLFGLAIGMVAGSAAKFVPLVGNAMVVAGVALLVGGPPAAVMILVSRLVRRRQRRE